MTQKAVKEAVAKVGSSINKVEAELKANKPAAKKAPDKNPVTKKVPARKVPGAYAQEAA